MNKLYKVLILLFFFGQGIQCASAASTISFDPQTVEMGMGSSQNVEIMMDELPYGLSGFNLTLSVLDPEIAEITAVSFPGWNSMSDELSHSAVPSSSVWIKATDLNNETVAGNTNVLLGTLTLKGKKAGTAQLNISGGSYYDYDYDSHPFTEHTIPNAIAGRINVLDTEYPVITSVILDNNAPNTGDSILVTVDTTDNVGVSEVRANDISLTNESGIWTGIITAFKGTHFVNVSSSDAALNVAWNNSTSYIASTPETEPILPVAHFTANPTSGFAPLTVEFTDSSENATGWYWEFGDGTTYNRQNATCTYSVAGTYKVNLTASNVNGANTTSATITVSEAPVIPDTESPIIASVNLNNSTPNTGDSILVTVNTTDNVGVSEVKANDISLTNESGNWIGIITALEGTHFVNVSSSDAALNVAWNNSTSYTASTSETPDTPTGNTISFDPQTVEMGMGSSQNVEIMMDALPYGLSGYDLIISVLDPEIAEITNVSFPDWSSLSNKSSVPSSSVRIRASDLTNETVAGNTNVLLGTLTLKGKKAGTAQLNISGGSYYDYDYGSHPFTEHTIPNAIAGQINVLDTGYPVINSVSLNNSTPNTGDSILVTVDTTDNVGVREVKANDISLTNESGNWIGIITALEGTHFVNVSSADEEGNVAWNNSTSYTASTPESEPLLPVADFETNVNRGYAPLTVRFTECALNATSWAWDFDNDGNIDSTSRNPTYIYTTPGTYTAKLTVSNEYGPNSKSVTITVLDESERVLPVADFESNVSSGYAPLSVKFIECSEHATELNWDFNNDGVIDSTAQNPVYVYTSPGTYTVSLTAINENGRASKTTTIRVYEASSGGSSSGGSSGSGGGGGSPEPATNVQVKEISQTYVSNGKSVKFDFSKQATCVMYVSFDSKKSAGKTTSSVEMLKGKSTLVSELPAGEVYKSFNIWVGNAGFATSSNIENSVICFKVEKSWIKDNRIIPTTINLYRYNDNKWNELETSLLGEDDKYLYFVAKTPGFSPFAIGGESAPKTANGTLSNNDTQKSGENNTTQVEQKTPTGNSTGNKGTKRTPGFEMVYGITSLFVLFLYKKTKIN